MYENDFKLHLLPNQTFLSQVPTIGAKTSIGHIA